MTKPKGTQMSTTPPTRSSSRLEMNNIIALNNEVKDAVSARTYLTRTAMAISGKPFSTGNLSDILLHITQMPGINQAAQTVIRAVAFLLENTAEEESADKIAKLILTAIAPHVAKIHDISENLTAMVTKMDKTQTRISNTSNCLQGNEADMLISTVSLNSNLEKVQEAVKTLTTQVKEASQQTGYKAALLSGLDKNNGADHQSIRRAARNAIKARQILIDLPPNSQLSPRKVSHAQLTLKIKQALESIVKEDSPELETHAITQTRNGAIIIEMLTQQAADYLKTLHIKNEFINALDPKAVIKERTYPVIIQFTPITFNPNSEDQI